MTKRSFQTSEIAGSEVFDVNGERLGILQDVLPTGGNDIWVVFDEHTGAELLIPALLSVVKEVDVEAKRITVDLPPGLKEANEAPERDTDFDE